MKTCHHCGRELQIESLQRTDACPFCYSDLKCCLNCRFHDPGANNQCREPQAEWTPDKAKANFCEFFEFRTRSRIGYAGGPGGGARAAFDGLFRKKS